MGLKDLFRKPDEAKVISPELAMAHEKQARINAAASQAEAEHRTPDLTYLHLQIAQDALAQNPNMTKEEWRSFANAAVDLSSPPGGEIRLKNYNIDQDHNQPSDPMKKAAVALANKQN